LQGFYPICNILANGKADEVLGMSTGFDRVGTGHECNNVIAALDVSLFYTQLLSLLNLSHHTIFQLVGTGSGRWGKFTTARNPDFTFPMVRGRRRSALAPRLVVLAQRAMKRKVRSDSPSLVKGWR
jgi:hypothetical protein